MTKPLFPHRCGFYTACLPLRGRWHRFAMTEGVTSQVSRRSTYSVKKPRRAFCARVKFRFLRLGGGGDTAHRLPAWTAPPRFSPWRKRLPAEGGEAVAGDLRRGAGLGQAPVTASRCRAGTRPRSGRRRRNRPWRCSPASSSPRPDGPRSLRRAAPSPGYSPSRPAGP